MKIAIIADTHHGVRSNEEVFRKSAEDFYNKQFFPYLRKHGIKHIIHLGDFVDNPKNMDYSTLQHLKHISEPYFSEFETHFIAGNHDTYFKETNDVYAVNELFDRPKNAYTIPTEIEIDGVPILLVPWITKSNTPNVLDAINHTNARIAMGHLEITGFQMYRNYVANGKTNPAMFSDFNLVLSGHFHHRSTAGNITYVGAPYEMTWHDYNDWRGFTILDLKTLKMEAIKNERRKFFKLICDDKFDIASLDAMRYEDSYVRVIVRGSVNPDNIDLLRSKLEDTAKEVAVIDERVELSIQSVVSSDANTMIKVVSTSDILKKSAEAIQAPDEIKALVAAKLSSLYVTAVTME